MSKRISNQRDINNNDTLNNFKNLTPENKNKSINNQNISNKSPSFKFINTEDIDFDQVNDQNQSPLIKNSPENSQSVKNLKSKYNQPAILISDNFDNISEIHDSKNAMH